MNLSSPPSLRLADDDSETDVELVPAKTRTQVGAPGSATGTTQLPPALQPRQPRLIEVPGHRPQPDFRRPEPPPRDLQWNAPGPRPQQPIRPRSPLGPHSHESGPVGVDDLDRALRREPLPSPDKLKSYLPEPGSPLGIPLLDFNPFGSPGDPRTVDANRILAEAIEQGCEQALGKAASVTHFAGPGSTKKKERAVVGSEGRSFPDTETRITYKGVHIRIFGDTYTPKADRMPDSREQRQFARLDRNAEDHNRVYVRLPKPWMIGEEINPEKLKEFTRELCREVKRAVDEGRLGDDKDKLRLERLFEELTKRKRAASEIAP